MPLVAARTRWGARACFTGVERHAISNFFGRLMFFFGDDAGFPFDAGRQTRSCYETSLLHSDASGSSCFSAGPNVIFSSVPYGYFGHLTRKFRKSNRIQNSNTQSWSENTHASPLSTHALTTDSQLQISSISRLAHSRASVKR